MPSATAAGQNYAGTGRESSDLNLVRCKEKKKKRQFIIISKVQIHFVLTGCPILPYRLFSGVWQAGGGNSQGLVLRTAILVRCLRGDFSTGPFGCQRLGHMFPVLGTAARVLAPGEREAARSERPLPGRAACALSRCSL